MKILFATNNAGKLREVERMLATTDFELLSLADFPKLKDVEVEETGETFTENALLKATAFANLSQTLTFAEDSGLEVMALDNRPGVFSKRYGPDADARNAKLLSELEGVEDRSARFVSLICLVDPTSKDDPRFFKGVVNGRIADQPAGDDGFAYDFIFIPDGYDQTFAELGTDVKNKLSHRGKSLETLVEFLSK